jgi:hypothetical protein
MYQERSVATVILFSILTCGIYMYYWIYVTSRDINTYLEISDMDPSVEVLLSIFTCGLYLIYWYYKFAQRVSDTHIKAQLPTASDDAIICLVLGLFGMGIISVGIIQNNLNKTWAAVQTQGI